MAARHQIESHRFWDIVTLWAKEQLESEEVIARALAKGVVRDGLKLQSTDAQWAKGKAMELKGQPFVGFCATPGAEIAVLRAEALEHLLGVVRQAKRPSRPPPATRWNRSSRGSRTAATSAARPRSRSSVSARSNGWS